jgi:sulfonate transport system permease protein
MAENVIKTSASMSPTGSALVLHNVVATALTIAIAATLTSAIVSLTGITLPELPMYAIFDAAIHTITRVALGLAIGSLIGAPIGMAMGLLPAVNGVLGSLVHPLRQVPLFGWIPLIGLWAGLGEPSKLAFVALGVSYVVVIAGYQGARSVSPRLAEMAQILKLGRVRKFLVLVLPASALSLLAGVRISLGVAWGAAVGAEILMSSAPGIGNLIWGGREADRPEFVIAGLVVIALLGVLSNAALRRLEMAVRERLR